MGLWLGSPHCRSVLALRRLACLETAEALGWVQPLPPELGALFHRITGTLVRLIEPRR